MKEERHFQPGQNIALRQIWRGKLWAAGPEIVVQDKPDLLALYISQGAISKAPRTTEGRRITPGHKERMEYVVKDAVWKDFCCLRLKIPGASYSVIIYWNAADMSLVCWYINMEDPFTRTSLGFDYQDQELDILVKPDLSDWRWKDEDELKEAVSLGIISQERAAALYGEGKKAVDWLISGKSPFNGWEKWRPDPSWAIPVLPAGWDKI